MIYRRKPDVYEAYQFVEFTDKIKPWCTAMSGSCPICGGWMYLHGRLHGHAICPGDWVITDRNGTTRAMNPATFDSEYEVV